MIRTMQKAILMATTLLASLATWANGYSNIYVFGDSLSDTGNLQNVLQDGVTPGRFTNGPVAVEVVASAFGLSISNSNHLLGGALPIGNNFAVAGARTVDEDGDESTPDINLPTQVNAFLQLNGGAAPADALYVVLIGGNDIRAARAILAEGLLQNRFFDRARAYYDAVESVKTSVNSQKAQIEKLIAAGAQQILVVNAPDIGAIPETDLVTAQTAALADSAYKKFLVSLIPDFTTTLSVIYNHKLANRVSRLETTSGLDIREFDLFSFLSQQIAAADELGYTNTDDACLFVFSQAGAVNPECSDFPAATGFLFWDEIHPTTFAHQQAGLSIVESLLAQ